MVSEGACWFFRRDRLYKCTLIIIAILLTRTIALWKFNTYVKAFLISVYIEIAVSRTSVSSQYITSSNLPI